MFHDEFNAAIEKNKLTPEHVSNVDEYFTKIFSILKNTARNDATIDPLDIVKPD